MRTPTSGRATTGIAGVILGVVTVSGFVSPRAATADAGVISACYKKDNGQLRIVANSGQCNPAELFISWNIRGPQGPQGLQGPQGPQGDPGPQGPPGAAGLQLVDFSSVNDSNSPKHAFARCPSGKHVVGGGAQVFIGQQGVTAGPIAVKKSKPSDMMDGWAATAEEMTPTDLKWFVTAYALCANVAS